MSEPPAVEGGFYADKDGLLSKLDPPATAGGSDRSLIRLQAIENCNRLEVIS
jgi:hypothetical protein